MDDYFNEVNADVAVTYLTRCLTEDCWACSQHYLSKVLQRHFICQCKCHHPKEDNSNENQSITRNNFILAAVDKFLEEGQRKQNNTVVEGQGHQPETPNTADEHSPEELQQSQSEEMQFQMEEVLSPL